MCSNIICICGGRSFIRIRDYFNLIYEDLFFFLEKTKSWRTDGVFFFCARYIGTNERKYYVESAYRDRILEKTLWKWDYYYYFCTVKKETVRAPLHCVIFFNELPGEFPQEEMYIIIFAYIINSLSKNRRRIL